MRTHQRKRAATNICRASLSALAILLSAGCGGGPSGGGGNTGGGGGTTLTPAVILYVASAANGNPEILTFTVNLTTGALSSSTSSSSPQYLYEMRIDPSGRFLYGSDFDAGAVRSYSISSSTGALTETVGSPFHSTLIAGNGGPIALSPDGRFLFYSNGFGDITTFTVSAGVLTATNTVVQDANQPNQFAVDPAGKFLYVANHSDFSGGHQFSVFSIDAMTGGLSEIAGSPFTFDVNGNTEPSGIVVHPNGNFIYSGLSNSASIEGMTTNRTTGALALIAGSPWGTERIPQYVAISPNGKYVYVSTLGVGAIDAFAVDQSSGTLTGLGGNVQGNPTQMVIDPSNKFLYTVFPNFQQVAIYAIQSGGSLGSPVTVPAGPATGAIAITQLP